MFGTVKPSVLRLLNDVTGTGAGERFEPWGKDFTFHGFGNTTAGSGAAAIRVEVSNDGTNWITMGTITLTLGTTVTSDGFSSIVPWKYYRGNVASISGTGAKVSLILGNLAH